MEFDAALVFNTNTRNCLAVWRAGIRRRVTWAYKPVGLLTGNCRVWRHRTHPPVHEAEFALEFVRALGGAAVMSNLDPRLTIDSAAQQRVHARLQARATRRRSAVRRSSRQSWQRVQLARGPLCGAGRAAGAAGAGDGHRQPGRADVVRADARDLPADCAARVGIYTDLALPELVAAIAEQSVLVVSSTGPMHVAGILGTPVVALFSPHPVHAPAKWSPLGSESHLAGRAAAPGRVGRSAARPGRGGDEPHLGRERRASRARARPAACSPDRTGRLAHLVMLSPIMLHNAASRRAVLLDRDGTITRDHGFTHRTSDLELLPGAAAGLAQMARQGFRLFVVTNQSGVARGYFSEADVQTFHDALAERLQVQGVRIEGFYFCPFHPTEGRGVYRQESSLRKPADGMLRRCAIEHGLDLGQCVAIGDRKTDIAAGQAAGCRTILVQDRHGGRRQLPAGDAARLRGRRSAGGGPLDGNGYTCA